MRRAVLVALLAAGPALAQTQPDLDRQAGQSWQRADAAMNVAYRAAMARMKKADAGPFYGGPTPNPSFQNALLASQRAWLAFRDTECRVEGYDNFGGSMQPMTELTCKAQLTQARTRQLDQLQKPL